MIFLRLMSVRHMSRVGLTHTDLFLAASKVYDSFAILSFTNNILRTALLKLTYM